ncbi:hypothetical protein OEZ86_004363 [Tetradesmus obliquus]|nr:hypothetical protein OEZ86_004363 [Tetradesmus obliquus]
MGATKIVIYNDNSTDGIKEAVSPFGDRVVIVDLKKNIGGVPEDLSVHRVGGRQDWSFNHCKTTYAPSNGTGWFGIWDIDEFVYPCVRQSLKLQGGNVLWNAYAASTKAGADGHALHCSIFGPNHKDVPQGNDTLVLANNIMRAPHPGTEPAAAAKAWEAVAEGCNKCGCCNNDYRKTIYDLSKVAKLRFNTHGPFNKEAVIDNSWQKPMAGLCCNHYQFKSTEEARAKASANLNDLYNKVTDTPDAKEHYTMLMDTLAWQYLPDLLQLLQQKGFRYKMPEVPLLIARD